ncbi:MAG: TrkH family potassium uptake protein, partial [Rikenellaceae bacterium]|nr:TrkH family potassium uptake protein [Rikenellaceae bacterium]
STAGGLKVNTLGVAWANFLSVIRGRERVTLFGREIPAESVRRASATIFASMSAILTAFVLLVAIEPAIHPTRLLFETISALSTVGSSLGVTPELGEAGKLILTGLMFMGRVGLITVLMSLLPARPDPKYRLPKDNVIIN